MNTKSVKVNVKRSFEKHRGASRFTVKQSCVTIPAFQKLFPPNRTARKW